MSKILERLVLKQIERHLATNKLLKAEQSAKRVMHSAETALLKVRSEVLPALD